MLRPCRAAVIGDMMLDRYVNGNADRISPEAPIPILDVTDEYQMLGGAANVAMKVAELGSSVGAVGLVGVDAPGGSGDTVLGSGDTVLNSGMVPAEPK